MILTGTSLTAASVSGKTGASGTISSLREMVREVSLVPGGVSVARISWAVTLGATNSTHAASQRHMAGMTMVGWVSVGFYQQAEGDDERWDEWANLDSRVREGLGAFK